MSDVRELLLIRHGRVDHASRQMREGPRGSQWDPPLDARGREQARRLAARLMVLDTPAVVATSPMRRCLETIAPYAEASGIDPVIVEDIREVSVGSLEGRSFEEIVLDDEELAELFRMSEQIPFGIGGGETGPELRARVRPAVDDLIAAHPDGNVIAISHGGAINAYINPLLAFEHDMLFVPENTSVNTIVVNGADRRVKFLNDTRHISSPELYRARS